MCANEAYLVGQEGWVYYTPCILWNDAPPTHRLASNVYLNKGLRRKLLAANGVGHARPPLVRLLPGVIIDAQERRGL